MSGKVICTRGCHKGKIYWRCLPTSGQAEAEQPDYIDRKGRRTRWHSLWVPCTCSGLPTPLDVPEPDPLPANCWLYPCFLARPTTHADRCGTMPAMQSARAPLSFAALRTANEQRLPHFKNKHGEPAHSEPDGSDWSDAEWLQAVVGELGEYASIRKKVTRGDYTHEEAHSMMADELADVVCYLDILAYRLGVDLGEAVRSKFNQISDCVGCSDIKL